MPTFKNFQELEKYINNQGNSSKINAMTNNQLAKVLQREGERLKTLIEEEIATYYTSYDPVQYERTYSFLNSVRITPVFQEGFNLSVKIYFDEDLATHDSIFGGESGYVPILINEGWKWHNKTGPYRLASYEGFNFIEKAIDNYNFQNPYGFKIVVHKEHNGKVIQHREY